ncbi:hypothetical protein [Achromobacter sp. NCFB-sbj8-Ac1-l]|uniref:hypothetical protein n=1 Tax=unclassified Achromobacter TaxID=2626865 RepID=UPI004046E7C4
MTAHATAQSRPPYDRYMVGLHLDCMEDQKDKLQAMLIAIRDAASAEDVTLLHLIEVAKDIVEHHAAWYRLRDCLGIKRGEKE